MANATATPARGPAARPCIQVLLADDDAASRRYLGDGLAAFDAVVTACGDGPDAIRLAETRRFDLLLLDCRMPGCGAVEVLAALRANPAAASGDAIAVASTAEPHPAVRSQLAAAGFRTVLPKPCDLTQLRGVLLLVPGASPLIDDTAAINATGNAATMRALRGLLQTELVALRRDLAELAGRPREFGERLHRLRSSCGFCGTPSLAAATAHLQQRLHCAQTIDAAPLAAFDTALETTLHALADHEHAPQERGR